MHKFSQLYIQQGNEQCYLLDMAQSPNNDSLVFVHFLFIYLIQSQTKPKTHMYKAKNKPNQNQPTKPYTHSPNKTKPKQTKQYQTTTTTTTKTTKELVMILFTKTEISSKMPIEVVCYFYTKWRYARNSWKCMRVQTCWFMWNELKWQSLINASYQYWGWLAEAHKGCCGWKLGAADSPVCC